MKRDVGFPVYALQWQNDTTIVASGGGGIGKSGVRNKIVRLLQQSSLTLDSFKS